MECKQCRLEIDERAKVCPHCQSRQDWRSHLQFSNVLLALLVALISVTGATLPVIADFLLPKRASPDILQLHVKDDRLSLIVSNSGSLAAAFKEAYIELTVAINNNPDTTNTMTFPLKVQDGAIIVPPENLHQLDLILQNDFHAYGNDRTALYRGYVISCDSKIKFVGLDLENFEFEYKDRKQCHNILNMIESKFPFEEIVK
ncbi:hypothetical protein NOL37_23705 [Vibrio parahaemolyticus]|uniref:hypothetical protein n=1 Tax=Vibrio parahaemolyticus TaxID=670 RepID=UPI00226A895B|nr:hypothetical protein [Vibrio parahaemolyticus]MCX8865022.1 hypothetical protein [Vibrio parahaemolyticus]MCX8870109.1 hypothetical protein [Vibrio parahaemolyticus]